MSDGPGSFLRRPSPVQFPSAGGGVSVEAIRHRAKQPVASSGGGVAAIPSEDREVPFPVQSMLRGSGTGPLGGAAGGGQGSALPPGAPMGAVPHSTLATNTTAVPVVTKEAAALGGTGTGTLPAAGPMHHSGVAQTVPVAASGVDPATSGSPAAVQEHYKDRPSMAQQVREMVPNKLDPAASPAAAAGLERVSDNTAGYDAGTASRGGGTGGTTEAMTGGLASGGAIGDERRSGLGDIGRGQL